MSFHIEGGQWRILSCSATDVVDVQHSSLCPWFGTVALRNENLDEECP